MFNQLSNNLTDASPADFSSKLSTTTPSADGSGLRAPFATELNRSVVSQSTALAASGSRLPQDGNALPVLESATPFQESIDAGLAGVTADDLQRIYSDLEELAELSGGSSLLVDDAISRHDKLFSAEVLGLSGALGLKSPTGVLPDATSLPTGLNADADGLPPALNANTALGLVRKLPTAGYQPLAQGQGIDDLQSTDRALDQLERTLQAVTGGSRGNEQLLRPGGQSMNVADPELLEGRAIPQAAPVVNIDGKLTEAERYRFRPIGLTPISEPGLEARPESSANAMRSLTTDAVSRFETLGVLSDGLRTDANLLNKPASGGFQVHAPSIPQTAVPNTATPHTSASGLPMTDTVQTAVQDSAWGDRIGERVALMANNRLQNAELRLTPAELGPLRVKVSIEDGLANVSFVAQHSVTRDAIEQAMPRLREMLEQQGINLGQSSVDEQSSNAAFTESEGGDGESRGSSESGSGGESQTAEMPSSAAPRRVSNNLLDTFV